MSQSSVDVTGHDRKATDATLVEPPRTPDKIYLSDLKAWRSPTTDSGPSRKQYEGNSTLNSVPEGPSPLSPSSTLNGGLGLYADGAPLHSSPTKLSYDLPSIHDVTRPFPEDLEDEITMVPKSGFSDRYNRPRILPDGHKVITFKPRLRPVEREERIPDGWTEYVHLEGQLYYCRTESIDGHNISIVTDYPLRPRENHFKMVQIINTLRKALHGHPILEDRDLPWCEICVIVSDNKATQFGYYIANHQDQTLFWLQEVEAWQVGISEYHETLAEIALSRKYWRHVTDYPSHRALPDHAWDTIGSMMVASAVDLELCDVSTSVGDRQTTMLMHNLWDKAKGLAPTPGNIPYRNWVTARLWWHFTSARTVNYFGTDFVRLERTSVIGAVRPTPSDRAAPPFILFICQIVFFNEPMEAMQTLDSAWIDGVVDDRKWNAMMNMLQVEWERIFVLSTVAFAAAMAFLAIPLQAPGNDNLNTDTFGIISSLAETSALVSCLFSMASLVAALNLRRDFGGKIMRDPLEVSRYLSGVQKRIWGYLRLGICLSLPRILFQWSLAYFCIGLAFLAFQLQSSRPQFFYAEVAFTGVLIAVILGARFLSPERMPQHTLMEMLRSWLSPTQGVEQAKRVGASIKKRTASIFSPRPTLSPEDFELPHTGRRPRMGWQRLSGRKSRSYNRTLSVDGQITPKSMTQPTLAA